ncbi:nucleoside deaminase [Streptomyces sp. NPDC058701]|uniref:nucleoside deaminase n=1 Tax=Streptomyces sp. NPDC058701 TaxID=3346608 RepID=UPI003667ECE4
MTLLKGDNPAWGQNGADLQAMRIALEQAIQATRHAQMPFGACVVLGNKTLSIGHNTVFRDLDVSRHAEINAIRLACQHVGKVDLSGCVLYTSCEPCPMCLSACYWAKISKIFYAASIEDADRAGFRQLPDGPARFDALDASGIGMHGGLLREESIRILTDWTAKTMWVDQYGIYQRDQAL